MTRPLAVVIDDDPQAAEAVGLTVRDWGADVIVAANAAEALALLGRKARVVSWIITDYELGAGVKGVDDVQSLRAVAPNARILVLSGARGSGDAAARAGFDNMSKPANAAHIHAWLASG
ncbi:MAG TPA: response regulator [Caulobacterales bacterium]|nr:response regulator [Caulobacterales bacterium]